MKKSNLEDGRTIGTDGPPATREPGASNASGASEALDMARANRIFTELGADWTFIVRRDPHAGWCREWIGGDASRWPELAADGFESSPWERYVIDEDRGESNRHFTRALEIGMDRRELRLESPDRGVVWVESALRRVAESEAGGSVRVYGTMRDITDGRARQEVLRASESQYRALVEQATDGILVFDDEGRIVTSNSASHDLFRMSRAQLHTQRVSDLFHEEDPQQSPTLLRGLDTDRTIRDVRRLRRSDEDDPVWVELSARRLEQSLFQVNARDISARMEAEQRIRSLAFFDSLTSLPNRELFREQVESARERMKARDKQLALLFLDIDRFKQVNDSLGHTVGDDLLKQIADRLRSAVRGSDAVGRASRQELDLAHEGNSISRLGGDEFTILIEDLDHAQDAARVARRVLHALSRPVELGEREVFVGASIGIAVWPEDGDSSEDLLRSADVAMYHAKSRGGHTYEFFNEGMNAASSRRLTLETRMRRALERDEFHLVYQPIRDARTGRVSAAEALIRWVDADGGVIGPDEFIPIAEETGLIVEIGAWVLKTACQQAVEWQRRGYQRIRLSVNLSVEQLRDLGIANTVDQILFDTGLDSSDLELEITESSILDSSPAIVSAVTALTEMGIGFALDDFGTGYSSLSALQRFPIERLKIDRTFVAGVGDNQSDEALTSAILALAKRLDQRVVAEGVETETQARFLTSLGCDELQGYLFSRPLPPEEFEAYLREAAKSEVARPEGAR